MATSPLGSLPSFANIPQPAPFNPLEALLGGFQQGVGLAQLPQKLQNDALNQQIAQALQMAQLESIPLKRQQQELALQQLRAQLDPNYAAQQNAQRIAFDTARERAMLGVRQEFDKTTSTPVQLKFTETDTEIVAQDPFTGAVKNTIKKIPGAKYQTTTNGVMVFTDPSNPTIGTIVPGSEPVAASGGDQAQPVFDPSGNLLGYSLPKNFKSAKEFQADAPSAGDEFSEQRAQRNLDSIAELKKEVSSTTVGLGSLISKIPGTKAADFQANVDTLKANVAFSELQAMRNASKTGGALGQVAVRELELLQSALGALDTRQSKESFLKNLNKIEESINKFKEAEKKSPKASGTSTLPKVIKITPRAP